MNAERLRQIEELYHAARERSPEEQAALLAEVQLETRCEVEALLARDVAESTETMLAVGSQFPLQDRAPAWRRRHGAGVPPDGHQARA